MIRALSLGAASSFTDELVQPNGLRVRFNAGETRLISREAPVLDLAMPRLAGPEEEALQWEAGEYVAGIEIESVKDDVEEATARLYTRLLNRVRGLALARVWNYVPDINGAGRGGLENYRSFSRARANAFEQVWGSAFTRQLPAASAVGGAPDALAVVFLATRHAPRPVENPAQLPAYEYPREHGPRSPSFCRANCVQTAARDWIFISGTAAIQGHQSIAPGQLLPQLGVTLENLRLVGAACGLPADLGRTQGWQRQFKVYLRHARDLPLARQQLVGQLVTATDTVHWLESAICRAELMVEIEVTLWRARQAPR